MAAADPAGPVVAREGSRKVGRTAPDRHVGAQAVRGRPLGTVPAPGVATAAAGPTVTGEGIVRPSVDLRIGRLPTPDAASGSVARLDRRAARQVGRRAAVVRGPGTARGTATDRVRRTPTVRGAGNDRPAGAGRLRVPRTDIGRHAPACRPARAIATAIDTKVRPP